MPSPSMPPSMHFGPERFDAPDVQALAHAQQAEMRGLYEGEGDIGPARDAAMFEPPDGLFLVGRVDGCAVACGGVCRFDATRGELKRMYVVPGERGLGYVAIVLETADRQAASLGLYASAGYVPIPCYGVYAERAISRCLEKLL